MLAVAPIAWSDNQCTSPEAESAFRAGFRAQQHRDTDLALQHYQRCLATEPSCISCLYETGWTHWSRMEWPEVVEAWERVKAIAPQHSVVRSWLPQAVGLRNSASGLENTWLRVPIGTTSDADTIRLRLIARFQNYNSTPTETTDYYSRWIASPKSAIFLGDGSRVYVNSLEGFHTLIYDPAALAPLGRIEHSFGPEHAELFQNQSTVFGYPYNIGDDSPRLKNPNHFDGKPVELALSHDDRYLWVPYYRRDFDERATSPSAVSIIDTQTNAIVRIMPTGPIPKYVVISPDNKWAAIVHWGDNTLGLIDISSADPTQFRYRAKRLVVEHALPQTQFAGESRDTACGFCLRGAVFTPDSRLLLVGRMGGGGLAGFDVTSGSYLGTLTGEKPTPRHLLLSPDGEWLYMSSGQSGYLSKARLSELVSTVRRANGEKRAFHAWESVYIGPRLRTIKLTADGSLLFAAVNGSAEMAVVEPASMTLLGRIRTDAYAVGLDVTPDGHHVWVTSQGYAGQGGNSISVYAVERLDGGG